jgi:hypothetical protein
MKINDVNFGSHRPDALRKKAAEQAESVKVNAASDDSAESSKVNSVADRVEISDSAREVSGDQEQLKREIEFARRAMYSIPPMSKERAVELLKRLDQGEYDAPDVRMKLSEVLTRQIAPDAPEAGGEAESA